MDLLPDWQLTPQRIAVHRPTQTVVVADLHLGYAEARCRRGEAIPRESVRDLLRPILQVKEQYGVKRLVIAGDLLEDGGCHEALRAFLRWIDESEIELVGIVPGNHDSGFAMSAVASLQRSLYSEGLLLGQWHIVHGEGRLPDGPVVHGHDHPCLRWSPRNRAIQPRANRGRIGSFAVDVPCYLVGPQRLILPAFSQEAAGVNILSMRRWREFHCSAITDNRVLDLGEVSCLRGRLSRLKSRP